jgi:hypothetical protein
MRESLYKRKRRKEPYLSKKGPQKKKKKVIKEAEKTDAENTEAWESP